MLRWRMPSPLTDRFVEAVAYANEAHKDQTRKGTPGSTSAQMPYISHLLAVAGLVLEDGGKEDDAIAGLLHDVIEDQDQGPGTRAPDVVQRFGKRVLQLVEACSGPKKEDPGMAEFRVRKQVYLDHLRAENDASAIRVSLADKVHNARSTVNDLEDLGASTWDRFNAGAADQIWWYNQLAEIYAGQAQAGLASATRVAELQRLVGVMKRYPGSAG